MPIISAVPLPLQTIVDPPSQLFVSNEATLLALLERPRIAIVGSRKASPYGRAVTERLAGELASLGVVIVSGLALGIDGIAHQATLDAGGQTIAVLPSGLDRIYPGSHAQLAQHIIERGGVLVSEFPPGTTPYKLNFLIRNRLISGLSDGVLVPEAAERSGSLNTVRHALEQGRTVMAVPGNITSAVSVGTNNLLKAGAVPVTSAQDVLQALGLTSQQLIKKDTWADNAEEARLLKLLEQGINTADDLLRQSGLETTLFNQTLTMLEITGRVRATGGGQWIRT